MEKALIENGLQGMCIRRPDMNVHMELMLPIHNFFLSSLFQLHGTSEHSHVRQHLQNALLSTVRTSE